MIYRRETAAISLIPLMALTSACVHFSTPISQNGGSLKSCGIVNSTETFKPVEFLHRQYSGITQPLFTVVRNASEWHSVWRRICQSCQELPPDDPDFEKEMLIVAALGESSGAYLDSVDSFGAIDGRLDIVVRREVLGAQCIVTMGKMQPVAVARVSKSTCQANFRQVTEKHDCGNR